MERVRATLLPYWFRFAIVFPCLEVLSVSTESAPREIVRALERIRLSSEVSETFDVYAKLVEDRSLKIVAIIEGGKVMRVRSVDAVLVLRWIELDSDTKLDVIDAETLRRRLLDTGRDRVIDLGSETTISEYIKQNKDIHLAYYVNSEKIMYVDVSAVRRSRRTIYGELVRYVIRAGIAAILIG